MPVFVLLIITALLSGCGDNEIQRKDEAVKASWAQVLNVYKRRADLIPSLVVTVKGYAQQEEKILIGVTEARAKIGQSWPSSSGSSSPSSSSRSSGWSGGGGRNGGVSGRW